MARTPARKLPTPETTTSRVVAHVIRRFPEMKNVTPSRAAGPGPGQSVFTFKTQVVVGGGRLTCIVRVVVDEQGRILRTVSSH